MTNQQESTYALLVRSEEKNRGVLEIILYALFIFSALVPLWQFAQQPVKVPAAGLQPAHCVACMDAGKKRDAAKGHPASGKFRTIEKSEPLI
ncbi:MAG: hypothetical protein WA183_06230 [Chthoniobacterales bacterium]